MEIIINDANKNIDVCPICNYIIDKCQCRYGGSAHPDRHSNMGVVLDHLYLLSEKQLKHIIELQKQLQISYGDAERNKMLNNLKLKGTTYNK